MSARTNRTGFLHLVYQEKTGFQYYITLPKHFSSQKKLPKQIRWALGHDAALARSLAQHLNLCFEKIVAKANPRYVQNTPELLLFDLATLRQTVSTALSDATLLWSARTAPTELAKKDLSRAYQRLMDESQATPVLYSDGPGGEIYFALTPSPALIKTLGVAFTRFDWPLGTTNGRAAYDAATYIYAAIEVLERTPAARTTKLDENPLTALMSLYEYLCHARPDKGRNLTHIPPGLPQSLQSTQFELVRAGANKIDQKIIQSVDLLQEESGLYALNISVPTQPNDGQGKKTKQIRIELLTSSILVAVLMMIFNLQAIDRILLRCLQASPAHEDPYERAIREISDLIRRALGPILPAEPMYTFSALSFEDDQSKAPPQDPGTLALLQALSSVLPEAQKTKLSELFSTAPSSQCILTPPESPSGALHFASLVAEFETKQVSEGAWANPRTQVTAHARLEGLCELIGGHRRIDTLTRAEFNTLRDSLRAYPKNRHRLRATRNQPLSKIINDGKFEPINPRTAKKFFELARAVIGYAHDQGYLKENIAAGLTFSTKGAPPPRKRTYSPGQIDQLLKGPVYSLTAPPRWRLDDYRFWLPILGLYSGARLSELCQLRLGDVREELGVWVISINLSGAKQLKTLDSERLVPLHKVILEAGFLDFHQQRLTAAGDDKNALLFDSIRTYGDLSPGHIASRWFLGSERDTKGYLGLCGLGEDNLTFHGLRHTFINQLRRQKLDMLIGKALVGHADRSTTGGYGDCYPAQVLKDELDKIDFEIPTRHINYKNYQNLQQKQGAFRAGRPAGASPKKTQSWQEKRHWTSYVKK